MVLIGANTGSSHEMPQAASAVPAATVEELAQRLRGHELRTDSPVFRANNIFAQCSGAQSRLTEPQGIPVYAAVLATDPPLQVRFLKLPDAAAASRLAAAAVHEAQSCAGAPAEEYGAVMEGLVSVRPFDRSGWSGVQVVSEIRARRPTALIMKPMTFGRLAAASGAWVVDVAWEARGSFGYPQRRWTTRGLDAAEWALSHAGAQARQTWLNRALPDPDLYGRRMQVRPKLDTDLACANVIYREDDPPFAPSVHRSMSGEAGVHESISIARDETQAEQIRHGRFRDDITAFYPGQIVPPCSEPNHPVGVTPTIEAFRHDRWAGEIERFAAREPQLPRQASHRESYAHVALSVRTGNVVVYLRWQAPAGTDLEGALRRGEAELRRALDHVSSVIPR